MSTYPGMNRPFMRTFERFGHGRKLAAPFQPVGTRSPSASAKNITSWQKIRSASPVVKLTAKPSREAHASRSAAVTTLGQPPSHTLISSVRITKYESHMDSSHRCEHSRKVMYPIKIFLAGSGRSGLPAMTSSMYKIKRSCPLRRKTAECKTSLYRRKRQLCVELCQECASGQLHAFIQAYETKIW